MSISFFDDLAAIFSPFGQFSLLGLLSRSPEVEHNPKTSISFFADFFSILGGGDALPSNLRKIGLNMNAIEKVNLSHAQAILQSHSPSQVSDQLQLFQSLGVGVGGWGTLPSNLR